MKVLDAEKEIGVEVFFTDFDGVGGKLRTQPEDFSVREISNYPPENRDGRFLIADITATHWETNLLIRELSDWLHISKQRIGFAGTKDKRAKTKRAMSFYNVREEKLANVKIKDVEIENIYRSNIPIRIGFLKGNNFELVARNIGKKVKPENVRESVGFFQNYGVFPNFYGIQRFGIIRPITHIVGKHIVRGEFEKAAMTYIANPMKAEDKETFELRKKLEETHDFAEALKNYPKKLNFEKAILNKLVVDPKDFIGALKELPRNLITMFVYAYQSYLFNKILSERIRSKIPLNEAIIGDIILPIRKGVVDEKGIFVSDKNIEKVNKQISKGKAVVSSVLFGSDSIFSEEEMEEIEHKIIEKEKILPMDFIIPDIPFISSSGSRRPIFSKVKNLDYKLLDDDLNPGRQALILKFELQKGCYATSFIREIMKTDDIKNY
jgi:tRNA pseudouridine13 synthase